MNDLPALRLSLAAFVESECQARLRAYSEQPRDAAEHFETENDVMSGGYAYRQLFELVQNAADAILEEGSGRGRIAVHLSAGLLQVANTGAALDKDGIVALLNARSSSKRGNQIGRFGIGFKSLLKLGGRVDIVSRSVGLRFDPQACRDRIRAHLGLGPEDRAPGMRLASVIDPEGADSPLARDADFPWATTVVTAEVGEAKIHDRLATEITEFPAEFLLFIKADITLEMRIEEAEPRVFSKRHQGEVVGVGDGETETRWRLFERDVTVEDPDAISDATHIQARAQVPLSWAMPLESKQAGRFWAFFPTQTPSRTAGILNAPWKVNSDRTNLVAGEWNKALMHAAAEMIAEALPKLGTKADRGLALLAFPRKLERQDEIAVPLVRTLWDCIVTREVLPDATGGLQRPEDMRRHPVEIFEIVKDWAGMARASMRAILPHPDCYRDEGRISRLGALVEEARQRRTRVLAPVLEAEWLRAMEVTGETEACKLVRLVAAVAEARPLLLETLKGVGFVWGLDEQLHAPKAALIVQGGTVPSGFAEVAPALAGHRELRKILVDRFGIRVQTGQNWPEILRASREGAVSIPGGWQHFWDNVAAAPGEIARNFLAGCAEQELMFPAANGTWQPRTRLVVTEQKDHPDLPASNEMAAEFVARMRERSPARMLATFPAGVEIERDPWEYSTWVQQAYVLAAAAAVGRRPQRPPQLSKPVEMPAGWRLLSILPGDLAVAFTLCLLSTAREILAKGGLVQLIARTSPDVYPKVMAPHPLLHWLLVKGQLEVGAHYVELGILEMGTMNALAASGWTGLGAAIAVRNFMMRDDAFFRHLPKLTQYYAEETMIEIWQGVFEEAAQRRVASTDLLPLWEKAAELRQVPTEIPSPAGPLSLAQALVADAQLEGEDGLGILTLPPRTAALWWAAGAQRLEREASYRFDMAPDGPGSLFDLNPDLVHALEPNERLDEVVVLAGEGLEEIRGPLRRRPALAVDSAGVVHADRAALAAMPRAQAAEELLRLLQRCALIAPNPALAERLARLLDRRATELRAAVRAEAGTAERIWRAIGQKRDPLRDVLSEPVRMALTARKVDDLGLVQLALAVHGPSLVGKLREAMAAEGLDPPARWGGAEARAFVLDLGLPLDFAASISGKRDAELLVSGPLHLPKLHDYQEQILADIETLIASGTGRRRAVVSLPTGGGKTRVAAEAVVRLVLRGAGKRCALWIAQTDELCEQAVQCFRQLWINVGEPGEDLRIARLWGGQPNPAPPSGDQATVVVASIQTMTARLGARGQDWIKDCGILVLDECHHASTKSYTALMSWLDLQVGQGRAKSAEVPLIGLSATPWRGTDEEESRRLAARFDKRWFPADQEGLNTALLNKGVLAQRSYQALRHNRLVTLSPGEQAHVEKFSELPDNVLERMGEDPERNELILNTIKRSAAQSILLFANSVAHAEYLAARLHLNGVAAAAVSGKTDRLARQHFTRAFRSGALRVICNYGVLTTGFDAPKADLVLISRPVFSPVLYMQMVGRGLRGPANGGTDHCTIATVEDNIAAFQDRLAYHFCRKFFD